MHGTPAERLQELRRALGNARRPGQVTQQPFDYDPDHLHRLAALELDSAADSIDLVNYALDLRYETLQPDFLRYVLPFCLKAWRADLCGETLEYGGFVENFYPALVDGDMLRKDLALAEADAVAAFMRAGILEEIDAQRGLAYAGMGARPYRWIRALTTYGVFRPELPELWNAWHALETHGQAVAAVQYYSCLMYSEKRNPIFAAWTPKEGGGPPSLWDFEGHLYEHRWLPGNVDFVRSALTPATVARTLQAAACRLADTPDGPAAARVVADLPEQADRLELRCDELPGFLATKEEPYSGSQWSV